MPIDPISAGQAVIGGIQDIGGAIRQHKATKALEGLQTPTYKQNQGILDYYNQALGRYNVDPYSSAMYKMQQQNALRGTAQGIKMLQDRRGALGGISSLIQTQNDSLLKAGVTAENERSQRFGQLGGATQMKAGEDRMAWQQNELAPYEKKYNLLALKASGGATQMNAGMQNVFGGLQGAQQLKMAKQMYGTNMTNANTGPVQIGTNPDGSPKFGYR